MLDIATLEKYAGDAVELRHKLSLTGNIQARKLVMIN